MLPPHRPFRDKPARRIAIRKKNKVAAKSEVDKGQVPRLKPSLAVLANPASNETASR